ncbi:MAG: N-6 DNA methylase [Chitinispirillales bacterium]|jgi:hypothetical protein|nr:N-6 DNA methylase [Chitinispirillales bacterium]
MTTHPKITSLAVAFSKKWENATIEKRESQVFLRDFLGIFGITIVPSEHFEYTVNKNAGERGYIDCLIRAKIAVEMKSRGEDLDRAFEQLKDYVQYLPQDDIPKILMVCDFETIILDFGKKRFEFKTKELRKHLDLFGCLLEEDEDPKLREQMEASVKAAEKMAKLHDALKGCGYAGHDLEVYLVRLLFCLFAQDTNVFPKNSILEYVKGSKRDGSDLSLKIARLFEFLNIPQKERVQRTGLPPELSNFQYINGSLFAEQLSFADFDEKMRGTLIECAALDWSRISPAIFGAMFQGVMDKDYRREIGAHYTSEENILKVINPLFMNDLRREFERVKNTPKKLDAFHTKIAHLKFLDPACGCGNFLIIAYRELRKLELEILKRKFGKNAQLKINIMWDFLRVNVEQFYGIEHEEFPCQIARVGMWLTDHQMNLEASDQFGCYYARVPLIQSATIAQGNALRIDWESVVPKKKLSYILGNPPFAGARIMTSEQKNDILHIFGSKFKGAGNLDYVTAWYGKAANYIRATNIRCAFVSTNSNTQGEQAALLWKPLFEEYNVEIDFAYRTFVWSNEAKGKAAVYCVIIGFSVGQQSKSQLKGLSVFEEENNFDADAPQAAYGKHKVIYENDGTEIKAANINHYLVDAPNTFIESRELPLCAVPDMVFGSMPNDAGLLSNYSTKEKRHIVSEHPETKTWFKRLLGAEEFINNIERWCLWLEDVSPSDIKKSRFLKDILTKIRANRLKSKRLATRKLAETPYLFGEIRKPKTKYIIVPGVSSERRKYIPTGFLSPNIITNNSVLIIPGATLYHFGILTSGVHNIWTRAVCGRLKSDYRYSKEIVYNNFPWPKATNAQETAIKQSAQAVLDARAKFPDSSLADLYDPLAMPPALRKAHQTLDRAVMKLYKFANNMSEAEITAELMGRYRELVGYK